jgi:hypothetical protein
MAGLCREFGISRKTGYKIFTRYNEIGLEGLTDRSRPTSSLPHEVAARNDSPRSGDIESRWGSRSAMCGRAAYGAAPTANMATVMEIWPPGLEPVLSLQSLIPA